MQCLRCGAEFVPEQRFCRKCGLPTSESLGTFAPTQMMPDETDAPRNANTAPQNPNTNPVAQTNAHATYNEHTQSQPTRFMDAPPTGASTAGFDRNTPPHLFNQPVNYQVPQTPPAMYAGQPPYYQPPTKSGSSLGWLLGIGALVLVGVIFFMAIFISRASRSSRRFPPPPPAAPATPKPGDVPRPGTGVLSEAGAVVNAGETTITQKFPLSNTAKFSLKNPSGNISIEGTDSTSAEITVIKSGGDANDRREVEIRYSTAGGNLTLETQMNNADDIEVRYQIKLPRSLGSVRVDAQSSDIELNNIDADIEINSQSGKVDLAKVQGAVTVKTQSGDIAIAQADSSVRVNSQTGSVELTNVRGAVDVTATSNDISANFENTSSIDEMNFKTVTGDVDLSFKSDLNAELDAQTTAGSIDVKSLGVQVAKSPGHAEAIGTVGTGGQALKIKTVSGSIKVTKRS
ncbi:MAG: DUF4097 family beta strand repeat-containing protein [Acidobacteriota bacterium]